MLRNPLFFLCSKGRLSNDIYFSITYVLPPFRKMDEPKKSKRLIIWKWREYLLYSFVVIWRGSPFCLFCELYKSTKQNVPCSFTFLDPYDHLLEKPCCYVSCLHIVLPHCLCSRRVDTKCRKKLQTSFDLNLVSSQSLRLRLFSSLYHK
jgi:hypothetical protein